MTTKSITANEKKVNKKKQSRTAWFVLVALLVLCAVPVIAGASRIMGLVGGAEITPENARFFASPLPVVIHILGATIFCVLGAFQFIPALRRRNLRWHRTVGYLLVPAGLAAALSGLWMTLFYPWPTGDGELLYWMRLFFGSVMVVSILLAVVAVRRRDYWAHGDWMIRGYAIGLGAGTQVVLYIPFVVLLGAPDELARALLMGAGWVVNLAVAEWVNHRRRVGGLVLRVFHHV